MAGSLETTVNLITSSIQLYSNTLSVRNQFVKLPHKNVLLLKMNAFTMGINK